MSSPWVRDRAALRWIARRYLPRLVALSIAWEIAQLPLYTIVAEREWWYVAWAVAHCVAGDAMIGTFALALALIALRAGPLAEWRLAPLCLSAVAFAVAYTTLSEWMNVALLQAWAYAPAMPVLEIGAFALGLSPLAQWVVVPTLALALAHRAGGAPHAALTP